MARTYTSKYLNGTAVDAALDQAQTAVQPGDLGSAASCDIGTGSGDVAAGDHTHSYALDDLSDVATTGATDGQALVYDVEAQSWGPGTVATDGLTTDDVDDTPVDGATTAPVSSNWAYDHAANTNAHGLSDYTDFLAIQIHDTCGGI